MFQVNLLTKLKKKKYMPKFELTSVRSSPGLKPVFSATLTQQGAQNVMNTRRLTKTIIQP